jgi:hypothetical protein
MYCLCGSHQFFSWLLLDKSYCPGYRTLNELLDERAAEVLDSLLLLGRRAKLAQEAANLTSSNAFDAVDYRVLTIAHISKIG